MDAAGPVDGARALEVYASALIATRHFHRRLAEPDPPLAELEHVAECIARSAANPALSVVLALTPAAREDAQRAVGSACLSALVARRSADSLADVLVVVLAALLVDGGRARLAAASSLDLDVFSDLPDALDLLAPAATAALGVGGAPSPLREAAALTAFEVAWFERPRLGPLYGGALKPRLVSRVLVACRALLARLGPGPQDAGLSPLGALRELAGKPGADRPALRLIADAVGLVPTGTVVELDDGQWAVVAPDPPEQPGRPVLVGLVDERGRARDRRVRVEGSLVRSIEPKKAHFNPAFPLVTGPGAAPK